MNNNDQKVVGSNPSDCFNNYIYGYMVTAQDVNLYKSQIYINVLKLFSGLVNMKITNKLNWPYLRSRILHENTAL